MDEMNETVKEYAEEQVNGHSEEHPKEHSKTKKYFWAILIACLVAIVVAAYYRFSPSNPVLFQPSPTPVIITSSSLMQAVDIAELSTAEFRYKGIATVYKDEQKQKERCHICYNAIVKAGIDMQEIVFEVDNDNKKVFATLPEIELRPIIVDETSMSLIPSNEKIGIKEMLEYAKADVLEESLNSVALKESARVNLMGSIEALLLPHLKAQAYSLEWTN